MNKQCLLLVFLCATTFVYAQGLDPEFSFNLYFETAGGSKDTIELGYDKNATFGIDNAFGEIEYSSPLSTDKFRAFMNVGGYSHINLYYERFLRKQIVDVKQIGTIGIFNILSGSIRPIVILIPKDSLPVIAKWDKTLFDNKYLDYTTITDDLSMSLGCPMGEDDDTSKNIKVELAFASFKKYMKDGNSVAINKITSYLCINNTDTFALFQIFFLNNSSFTSNESKINKSSSSLSLYPNPVSDICYIKGKEIIKKVQVYDMSGKCVLSFDGGITQFSCNTLKKGLYAVLIETENGRKSYKLVK